ncbi:MAG TPA: site-specific integrase [Opitutaceae bacterium]|nr:site-specific integrase [Opitutaceae bacterium]
MSDRLFRKRPDGPWYAWFYTREGERVRFCTGQLDKTAAKRVLRDRERDQTAAAPGVPSRGTETVEDALRYLVEESMAKDWPASTLQMFADKAGHLLRLMGHLKLTEVTTAAVTKYINQRLGERASRDGRTTARETVRKELITLRGALREAEKLGWLTPGMHKALIPEFKAKYTPRKRWLSPTEFTKLAGALADPTRRKHAHEVAARRQRWVAVAVYLGGRLSEIESKLDWADVDLDARTLWLRGTKTEGSERHIPIPAELMSILSAVPEEERVGPVAGRWASVRRDLAKACARAGIAPVTPNDLRRTYASWLVNAGVPLQQVAKLMGHKSTRMVEKVYGHLSDATLAAAVAKLPQVKLPELPLPPIASGDSGGQTGDTLGTNSMVPMAQMAQVIPLRPARAAAQPGVVTATSTENAVPRAGIEPATRGFSGQEAQLARPRLRSVSPRGQ